MKNAHISSRKINLFYALVQCNFWVISAVVVGYASIFLLDYGISNSRIGILFALSGLIAFLIQPFIGSYADAPSSPSIKKILIIFGGFTVCVSLCLCISSKSALLLSGILYCTCLVSYRIIQPMINSLGTESINQGYTLNMGAARGMGSVVYSIVASVMGFLTLQYGNQIVPFCVLGCYILLTVSVFLFPFRKAKSPAVSPEVSTDNRKLSALFHRYPDFLMFLAGSSLVYFALETMATFQYQIIASRGANSFDLGRVMSLCAVSELPALFLFSRLLKKKTCDFWVRLSALFIALKCVGLLLSFNIPSLMATQLLQCLGWALYTIAPVYYVNRILPSEYAIRGQMCLNMTFTIGTMVSSFIGGLILEKAGVNTMLLLITIMCTAGTVLIFFFTRRNVE